MTEEFFSVYYDNPLVTIAYIVNIVNVVGNYLLINQPHTIHIAIDVLHINWNIPMIGAGMGVQGAALSTGISWLLGGVSLIAVLFLKKDPTRISLKESYRPDMKLVGRVMKLSIPAMLERIFMSSAGIILTKSIATLGTVAVAANSIYSNAEALSYMPGFAFGSAVTTLVGQALGAQRPCWPGAICA